MSKQTLTAVPGGKNSQALTAQCRYTNKLQRCPNPAVSPTGDVLLCNAHIRLTIKLLQGYGFTVLGPLHDSCDDCKPEEKP